MKSSQKQIHGQTSITQLKLVLILIGLALVSSTGYAQMPLTFLLIYLFIWIMAQYIEITRCRKVAGLCSH